MMRVRVVVMTLAACTLVASYARAADGGADDIKALEKQLSEEHSTLSTSDCNAACKALGSIRRAAEKICAIEPGPRCEGAREKAADATRRVHDACPDCALASGPMPPAPPPVRATESPDRAAPPANAPAREESTRGCASCASTDSRGGGLNGDLGLVGLAVFGALRVFRKRSRRNPPR
jgi:MYXO-CTERM domain-containing protein